MTPSTKAAAIRDLYEQIHMVHVKYASLWYHQTFLHGGWWVSLACTVIPWTVWALVRQKDSSARLMFVAFFVAIVTCWIDFLGVAMGLWFYKEKLLPTIPAFIPFDLCLFPVFVMLLIQYRPQIPPIFKAILFAGFSAFVAEPLFMWAEFYIPVNWSHLYSFVIYGVIYLASDWISKRTTFAPIR